MNVKRDVANGAIATVLGLSALGLGTGAGIASADPGQPCWQQCQGDRGNDGGDRGNGRDDRWNGGDDHQWGDQGRGDQWRPDQGRDQRPWDQRGVDNARFDHQPFNWQGQRVEPYWDQGRGAWGFWSFGMWIPL
jgi:hypothetical protein